jgi:hypothetical protein
MVTNAFKSDKEENQQRKCEEEEKRPRIGSYKEGTGRW